MKNESSKSGASRADSRRDVKGRWKPGHSGNPGGGPKGPSLTMVLRRLAHEIIDWEGMGKVERAEALAAVIWSKALGGDRYFVSMVLDRVDGPVKTVVENAQSISGDDLKGKRIIIEQTVVDAIGANMNYPLPLQVIA